MYRNIIVASHKYTRAQMTIRKYFSIIWTFKYSFHKKYMTIMCTTCKKGFDILNVIAISGSYITITVVMIRVEIVMCITNILYITYHDSSYSRYEYITIYTILQTHHNHAYACSKC